jgi:glyoxylase-like metal-dependent hydrolase (beta-lactamase superfamily II)
MDLISLDYPDGISTIDTGYLRPGFDASHLIVEGGKAAFVDVGTTLAVPLLLEALRERGIARDQVTHVLVTHVHLDHAGGAGALLQELPEARLVVHPRGARHLIDPARLIEGTIAVYGASRFRELYGEVVPVPEDRVVIAEDEWTLDFHGRPFLFLDTPGHARHHYCMIDRRTHSLFSGDNFGIAYRELHTPNGPFIFPTTTPVQFEPDQMHATLERLMLYTPTSAYLTHFGRVDSLDALAADLHWRLDQFLEAADAVRHLKDNRQPLLAKKIREVLHQEYRRHGGTLPDAELDAVLQFDYELNAQGIEVWLQREESAA